MIYFFVLLMSIPSWGCFVTPPEYPSLIRKKIETQVKARGFKIRDFKRSDEGLTKVTAYSKKKCRIFHFKDSINPDCTPSIMLTREASCK